MFLATKGYVRLEVKMNDELKITPFVLLTELRFSANATAKSITSILNFQLKGVPNCDKEIVAREYLEGKGWTVEKDEELGS